MSQTPQPPVGPDPVSACTALQLAGQLAWQAVESLVRDLDAAVSTHLTAVTALAVKMADQRGCGCGGRR